jgi:hypothetical protein
VTGQQDAEKRILNGKSQMGNGKNLTMCPLPFAISDQAGGFSAACQCWWPTNGPPEFRHMHMYVTGCVDRLDQAGQ